MWRKELGEWQERRHRRPPGGGAGEDALPASTAQSGSSRFMYKLPTEAPGVSPMEAPAPHKAVESRAAEDRHVTAQWVTVSGADHRDIGNIREYLDLRVGRTIAHYTISPLTAPGADRRSQEWESADVARPFAPSAGSGVFYLQFEDASAAARAVRIMRFVAESGWGVAAAGGAHHRARVRGLRPVARPTDSRADDGGFDPQDVEVEGRHSVEFTVTTCADRAFLAARAEAVQRQLWGHSSLDPEEPYSEAKALTARAALSASPSAKATVVRRPTPPPQGHRSLDAASPGRRSETLEPPHELTESSMTPPPATVHDDDGHPLLPRARLAGGGVGRRGDALRTVPSHPLAPSSGSSYSIDLDMSSPPRSAPVDSRPDHPNLPILPSLREGADGAHGRGGDSSFLQEEGHFVGRGTFGSSAAQDGNRSVVSLFFTSALSAYDNVWVTLARGAVVLVWTVMRFLGMLLQWQSLAAAWRRWRKGRGVSGRDADTVAAMDALSTRPSATEQARRRRPRRRLRHGGAGGLWWETLSLGPSPLSLVARLFRRCCVMAPSAEEVDLVLWSWQTMRNPFPQQSLRELKRYLVWHRPYYSPGQSDTFRGTPFTRYDSFRVLPRTPTAEEILEEEYYRSKGVAPPPHPLPGVTEPAVLLTWRPARVLTRYSLLSALVCLLALIRLYDYDWQGE